MQVVECWEVRSWDGGDMYNHKFYLLSEAEAQAYKAVNKNDSVSKKQIFTFFDTVAEAEDHSMQKVRERALAKLTSLERKALGY